MDFEHGREVRQHSFYKGRSFLKGGFFLKGLSFLKGGSFLKGWIIDEILANFGPLQVNEGAFEASQ